MQRAFSTLVSPTLDSLTLRALRHILAIVERQVLHLANKALNFKMDENEILDMKKVAAVFNMTVTDVVREAIREYLDKMKRDPFYRLTAQVQEASAEESAEILDEINALTDDDLKIATVKRFEV